MEGIVLRVRLISGDSMDVTYEKPDADREAEVTGTICRSFARLNAPPNTRIE